MPFTHASLKLALNSSSGLSSDIGSSNCECMYLHHSAQSNKLHVEKHKIVTGKRITKRARSAHFPYKDDWPGPVSSQCTYLDHRQQKWYHKIINFILRQIKNCRFAASSRLISRLGSAFFSLRWFKLAHICIQVTSLHKGNETPIDLNWIRSQVWGCVILREIDIVSNISLVDSTSSPSWRPAALLHSTLKPFVEVGSGVGGGGQAGREWNQQPSCVVHT